MVDSPALTFKEAAMREIADLRAALSAQAAAHVDERAAFEKAMNDARFFPRELNFARTTSPSGRDEYANGHLQSCWKGWQARAALAHPVAVDAPTFDSDYQGFETAEQLTAAIAAVDAQGKAS